MDAERTHQHSLLSRFSEFLAQQIGLHFSPERWPDLVNGIKAAAREFGFQDVEACMQWLLSTPLDRNRIETLACHLTVGETYFFRDAQAFDALQMHILPALIQCRRQYGKILRIWSAGCATGEEAYSLAILVQRLIPDFRQWHIAILGTDINPHALAKAESGIYSEWSFRNAPGWLKSGYFRVTEKKHYEIIPSVRKMVTFAYLNLMDETYPSMINNTNAIDIIFCRNVLMYFKPALVAQVVRRHCLSLVDGGWLIVSPAEVQAIVEVMTGTMETVNFSDVILYRKNATHAASCPIAPLPASPEPAEPIDVSPVKTTKQPAQKPLVAAGKIASVSSDYQQALALYQQGCYDEAAAQAVKLLADSQSKVKAMCLLARIHANQGNLAKARQWCRQMIDGEPQDPLGHYLMAIVLLEQGADGSRQELKRTLELDPGFVLAHFTLGNLCRQQGRRREAEKHFDDALRLLDAHAPEELLPETEGMTAGRLAEIIHTTRDLENAA
ncbi:MAG: CheR family methyltransferase [Methylococcaceae bacterium]